MTKKIVLVVFSVECVVLAVLLAREWTRFYISGPSEKAYATVYTDKVDAGHAPLTAEIDGGTTAFVIWWGGVLFMLRRRRRWSRVGVPPTLASPPFVRRSTSSTIATAIQTDTGGASRRMTHSSFDPFRRSGTSTPPFSCIDLKTPTETSSRPGNGGTMFKHTHGEELVPIGSSRSPLVAV